MDNETPTTEAVMEAYRNLPLDERRAIDELADLLMTGYQVRASSNKGLGFGSAIRLLGCLAVFVAENDYVAST